MKKFIFKTLALTALVLVSACSGSDDDNNSSVELEGTWKLTAWNIGESVDLNNDGTASSNLLDEMDCYNNETIVFSSTDIATIINTSYADIYVELEEGSETDYIFEVECELENDSFTATYVRNGNTVTFTFAGDVEDGEDEEDTDVLIATLDGDELSLLIPDGYYVEGDDFEVVVEQDLTMVYTKQ